MCALKIPEIHGHRGCRGLLPENTLSAFLYALELGVDVIEMDVVISADRQVVVSHEPWFNPLFCLDPSGLPIEPGSSRLHNLFELDYAIIRQYDCGSRRHPSFPEQVPQSCYKPLLREAISFIEAGAVRLGRLPVGYSIEIKSSPDGDNIFHPTPEAFLPLVLAELTAAGVMPRTTLLCFDQRILRLAYQHYPGLATCLLVEDQRPWATSLNELGYMPTTFGPDFTTVTAEAVKLLRRDFPNLRLVPWTVNEGLELYSMFELQVDGITTDYPDRGLQLFAAMQV